MGHDQRRPPQAVQKIAGPRLEPGKKLAPRRAVIPVEPAAGRDLGMFDAQIAPEPAGKGANIDFLQARVAMKILSGKDDSGGFDGAAGGAGKTRGIDIADQMRLALRLHAPQLGQGRIQTPLQSPLGVPTGFTVPHQIKIRPPPRIQTHFAIGGRLISTASGSWPVASPNLVPRS